MKTLIQLALIVIGVLLIHALCFSMFDSKDTAKQTAMMLSIGWGVAVAILFQ